MADDYERGSEQTDEIETVFAAFEVPGKKFVSFCNQGMVRACFDHHTGWGRGEVKIGGRGGLLATSASEVDRGTPMGATIVPGGVTFRIWAPNALQTYVL